MVGILGATGVVEALRIILRGLPDGFSLPVVVVVSMPTIFIDRLVELLAATSRLPVVAVEDQQVPRPGRIHVAATDRRLLLARGMLKFAARDPDTFDTWDNFLHSMATELGPGAVAVILSGFGEDCLGGIKAVRGAGGYTIAQDQQTSIVYALAKRAVASGAIDEVLPIQEIAPRLAAIGRQW